MAGVQVDGQLGAAQTNLLAVSDDAVRLHRGKRLFAAETKVAQAPVGEDGRVTGGREQPRTGVTFDLGEGSYVIEMGLCREQDADVLIAQAELAYAGTQPGNRIGEGGIDEYVPVRRGDQERSEIVGADVVDIANHP